MHLLAIYLTLLTHRSAITALRAEKRHLEEEVDELRRILKELSEGYNPNYQVCPFSREAGRGADRGGRIWR